MLRMQSLEASNHILMGRACCHCIDLFTFNFILMKKEINAYFFDKIVEMVKKLVVLDETVENLEQGIKNRDEQTRHYAKELEKSLDRVKFLERENADLKETVRTLGRENDRINEELDVTAEALRTKIRSLDHVQEENTAYRRQLLKEHFRKNSPDDKPQQ